MPPNLNIEQQLQLRINEAECLLTLPPDEEDEGSSKGQAKPLPAEGKHLSMQGGLLTTCKK